ncbi:hypothetical protein P12x_002789 [Tundrisphaera lichenicola]|uniref:hypothetical protein n=1 Tax=Tundrisphaera lichenicola TaxID=2029860 RepID=UPI003EBBBE9B
MKIRRGAFWLLFGGVALMLLASNTPARADGKYPMTVSPGFFDRPGTSQSQHGKYPMSVAPGYFERSTSSSAPAHSDPLASLRGRVYSNMDKVKTGSSGGRRGGMGGGGIRSGGGVHHAAAVHHRPR